MNKIILLALFAIGSTGLYFSCSNSGSGSGAVSPTSSSSDSTITLTIDGKQVIYYVVGLGKANIASKNATTGNFELVLTAYANPKKTTDGTITLVISNVKSGMVFQLKDNKGIISLQTPQILPAGGCDNNPDGNITLTNVIEDKSKEFQGSYPGSISGNFTATLCELGGDTKKHTVSGSFEKLLVVFLDPSKVSSGGTGSIKDANRNIMYGINGNTENKYSKVLSKVIYDKSSKNLLITIIAQDTVSHKNIVDLGINIINSPTSSAKGTYKVTKDISASVTHVTGTCKIEDGKSDYETYNCNSVEGTITITDEFKQAGPVPGFFEGYISGTYSFKVCDDDGNSATVKGSFTKLYTTFVGDF